MSYLTVPNALNDKKQVKGGMHALCMFVNHASEEVDKDPQLTQVYALINRASSILLKDFHTAKDWMVVRIIQFGEYINYYRNI